MTLTFSSCRAVWQPGVELYARREVRAVIVRSHSGVREISRGLRSANCTDDTLCYIFDWALDAGGPRGLNQGASPHVSL